MVHGIVIIHVSTHVKRNHWTFQICQKTVACLNTVCVCVSVVLIFKQTHVSGVRVCITSSLGVFHMRTLCKGAVAHETVLKVNSGVRLNNSVAGSLQYIRNAWATRSYPAHRPQTHRKLWVCFRPATEIALLAWLPRVRFVFSLK